MTGRPLRKGDRVVLRAATHIGGGTYAEVGTMGTVLSGGRWSAQVALDGLRDPYFDRPAQVAVPRDGGHIAGLVLTEPQSAPDASIPTPQERPAEGHHKEAPVSTDDLPTEDERQDRIDRASRTWQAHDEQAIQMTGRPADPLDKATEVVDAYRNQPDDAIWDLDSGETFGEARERFATFGTEVPDAEVPALLRAGYMVWSFGYGDDPEAFTIIDLSDLDNGADEADLYGWGPFRLDPAPPLVPEATAKRVIAETLAIQSTRHPRPTLPDQALAILEALRVAGVKVTNPEEANR